MDSIAVEQLLGQAVQTQTLRNVANSLLENNLNADARALAENAIAACSAISEHMLGVQAEVLGALNEKGVSAEPVEGPAQKGALQFHQITISIPRIDLVTVLRTTESLGFHASVPMTAGRVKALASHADQITVIRFDDVTARLTLAFTPASKSVLPARLRPGLVELGMIDLPTGLAALYGVLKPFRILSERLTGKRSPHHEIDFLGTPDGLIAPILEVLGVDDTDVLVDLGCGDGRVVIRGAEQFGCQAIGIEHNKDLVARAKSAVVASSAAGRIEIRQGDASGADLNRATVIFMFLPKNIVRGLLPTIRAAAPKGVRIAVHEQAGLDGLNPPTRVHPVFSAAGITVVHIWSDN